MAKTDWAQLNAEFLQEHEATGISAKDWCDSRGLNYNSARRYLKSRGQSPAQPDKSRVAAQSAHSEVRKTTQSAQSAQTKGNEAKAKGGERRGEKSSASTYTPASLDQNSKTNSGRQPDGRFDKGNRESVGNQGNQNPPNKWQPGDRPALTHGGYAKFLDAEELFDQARELQLRDELDFTRARVISVTKLLKGLQQDLVTASEMTDNAARTAHASGLCIVADADTGYGNAMNVRRTVRDYTQPRPRGKKLARRLRTALIDDYVRRDKQSRDYPKKKRVEPPGSPRIQTATPAQRRLALTLRREQIEKGLTA